ncbi:hypothetical protein Har1130_06015 [Haloarcula sp. CBA1130]|uniref:DUF5804 family protein n=1 Tax=unclassified Haloarcula TaxID=2624677 RepID=UPI0012490CF0|nr:MULTISPECIES: DUF5804 family protein [unclassified Haloarcula]KAA9395781.1 hypothetical protein Har1129_20245 [Haloarcula sp. CBA1129]KAA9397999.1 hypothetical protein Har1129_07125 [Haloarcula sp. CBA1129]KAA9402313.1 hypothetical protein Har1130_06015 [Haloarcula sp. CBA1130]
MTQVCLVGSEDVNLRYELLSRETARNALATYDLQEPFENTIAVDTVSLGAAVALLNDLNWYLVRFADTAFIRDPSISETEWLSRDLAAAIRDDDVAPEDTGRFLTVYGIVEPDDTSDATDDDVPEAATEPTSEPGPGATMEADSPPELVDPMLLTRTGDTIPEYDLQEVDDTLIVRVTESEFGA